MHRLPVRTNAQCSLFETCRLPKPSAHLPEQLYLGSNSRQCILTLSRLSDTDVVESCPDVDVFNKSARSSEVGGWDKRETENNKMMELCAHGNSVWESTARRACPHCVHRGRSTWSRDRLSIIAGLIRVII